jgi:hypothetical protein
MTTEGVSSLAIWVVTLAFTAVMAQPSIMQGDEFDGIDQSASNPTGLPADPDIAVSHDVIIQVVNRWMRMWARDGNGDWAVVGNADLTLFFQSVERDATDASVIFGPDCENGRIERAAYLSEMACVRTGDRVDWRAAG